MISVIVPVYNRQELVKETLDSVLAQTYSDWECIVVDDGSTDNSWNVLREYAQKDARIKPFQRNREPKGAPTCRNMGIDLSTGEYLMFLDSDDLLGEKCLEFRMEKVNEFPDLDAWIFDTAIFQKQIGDDKRMWNKLITKNDDLPRFLNQDMPWQTSGPLWRNKNLLYFDEEALSFQDWEYHIRFLLTEKNYQKFETSNQFTQAFCRRGEQISISTQKNNLKKKNLHQIIYKICLLVIQKKIDSPIHSRAVLRVILKWAKQERLGGFKKDSFKLLSLIKTHKLTSSIECQMWYFFIIFYRPLTYRFAEFFAYRIFKQQSLLNFQSNHLATR